MHPYSIIWAMYFSSVMSFQFHPGTRERRLSSEECARIADEMLSLHLQREVVWPGLRPQ